MKGLIVFALAFWLTGCSAMLCNSPIGDNKEAQQAPQG